MSVYNAINQLKHRIISFTLAGIILTASVAGISVVYPYYSFVKAGSNGDLIIEASNRAMLVEMYLNGLRDVAVQVASRTFARKQLEKFLQGKIDHSTLKERSVPVLLDAIQMQPELVAIFRYNASGQVLIHAGLPLTLKKWNIPTKATKLTSINGPIIIKGKCYIYVSTPVLNQKKDILGMDVLIFTLTGLDKIVHSPGDISNNSRVELGWVEGTQAVVLEATELGISTIKADASLAKAIHYAVEGKTNILAGNSSTHDEYMTAYSPVNNIDWGVTVTLSSAELYVSANQQIFFTGGIMLLVIIIGTIATFILIRPLSGKILLHSDDLEQKIDNKTVELQQLNKSLQALNKVNEVLLKTSSESDLLDEICQIIVDIASFNFAWIGLVNDKKPQQLLSATHYGCKDIGLNVEKFLNDKKAWSKSPGCLAMQSGEVSIFYDTSDPDCFGGYWKNSGACNCISVAAFPLLANGNTLGVLLVYATSDSAFDDEQVKLMQQLSDNLAFGLIVLRDKVNRKKLQRQLLQSQKMEAIGLLTGGIAHDFNNILASMLGYTELLQDIYHDEKNKEKAPGYLDCIEKSGRRARDLVSQMLAFSRGGSSEPRPLILEKMIKESLKMLQSTIPSSVELRTPLEDLTTTVMMDSVQFHQLMMNLCINARDAMEGSGIIDITVRRAIFENEECASCHSSLLGEYEELMVKDTGHGIEMGTLERIFDPFFTTKEFGSGSGMGLSMVHGIMHEHGGHIIIESNPGSGAGFRLLFPILETINLQRTVEVTGKKIARLTEINTERHILVVDDDAMVANFEKDFLLNRGYQVTVKTDSQSALELVKNNPLQFDLIITDQTMQGITGVEIVREIFSFAPNIPVILCTGFSGHVDEQHAKQMGIHTFLNKPVDTEKLLEAISNIFS